MYRARCCPRHSAAQILGCLGVVLGVVLAALPSQTGSLAIPPFWAGLFVANLALPSLATILKEGTFSSYERKNGEKLSVFVVNSFGSAA